MKVAPTVVNQLLCYFTTVGGNSLSSKKPKPPIQGAGNSATLILAVPNRCVWHTSAQKDPPTGNDSAVELTSRIESTRRLFSARGDFNFGGT